MPPINEISCDGVYFPRDSDYFKPEFLHQTAERYTASAFVRMDMGAFACGMCSGSQLSRDRPHFRTETASLSLLFHDLSAPTLDQHPGPTELAPFLC